MNSCCKPLFKLGVLFCALLAGPCAYAGPLTETEFRCSSASSSECHFVLYAEDCKETDMVNGRPSLVCTKSLLQEFTLKVGQTKKFSNLPVGYRQCAAKPGEKPSFPACIK